jgi:WD40 repeat protein
VTLAVGDVSTVTLWEAASEQPRRTLLTQDGRTSALAFSPDGRTLAAAGDRAVTVWDLATGRELVERFRLRGVLTLAFAPDGRTLATGDKEGMIRLWDLAAGGQRLVLPAHVRLWDLAAGGQRLVLPAHARQVSSLAFSDDGRMLASANRMTGTCARLWDVASGRGLATLRGHTAPVQSVTFAPGSRTVATASSDGTVRLWEVATGLEKAARGGLGVGACLIAFSPDGWTLAAGGNEAAVWVWDVTGTPAPPPGRTEGP